MSRLAHMHKVCLTLSWLSHWNNRPLTGGVHVQLRTPGSGEVWLSSGCVEMHFLEKVKCKGMWSAQIGLCACVCIVAAMLGRALQYTTWTYGARYSAT